MRALPLVAAVLVGLAAACSVAEPPDAIGEGEGEGESPALAELLVDPDEVVVPLGDSVDLEVVGVDTVGGRLEVEDLVVWSSSDDSVATVDADGVVTGVAAGEATVTVALDGVTADVPVTIDVPDPPRDLSYGPAAVWAAGAVVERAPSIAGGPVRSFSVVPSLPTGLQLDPDTGTIAGSPLVLTAPVDYVVTAENVAGSTTATLRITVVCEIDHAPPQDADPPDPGHVDQNADGVDGMACGPVYVAADAAEGGDGTKDAPLRSIAAAIVLAASLSPAREVYVAGGDYAGSLAIASGVGLHGGYDAAWTRTYSTTTRIAGGPIAVDAFEVDVGTTLSELAITADDAVLPGAPSIALRARDGAGRLTLVGVTLQAGRGARGADGADGTDGAFGDDGNVGDPGVENSTGICSAAPIPEPGAGGFGATFAADGGRGGYPGLATTSGDVGVGGGAGAAPGAGGVVDENLGRGDDGSPGGVGDLGDDGDGGGADSAGKDGQGGGAGGGGGGGGGGAGGSSTLTCDAYGGAGGGGGAGGTGGTAGTGGGAGGASIALYVEGTSVALFDVDLAAGSGGGGGDGGEGGDGALGGPGGPGGAPDFDEVSGAGGDGGDGGPGGPGGHGGGGGGGSSAAMWQAPGADVAAEGGATTLGLGGAPGGGPGFVGNPGSVEAVLVGAAL